MDHVQDDYLLLPSQAPFNWPSPARARFLVKVALSTVCQYYHIVRKSQVTRILEDAIKNNGNGNRVVICKLLALFALGEVYSAKHASMDAVFPGLAYFAQARRMISIPAERPQMDTIEVTLLLVCGTKNMKRNSSLMPARFFIPSRSIVAIRLTSSQALPVDLVLSWA
jgi:hypothetical protein